MLHMLIGAILVLSVAAVSFAYVQTVPAILQFTSDRLSVTPDEAESGGAYTTLTWQTAHVRESDSVHLQVLVAGAWHDISDTAQPPNGTQNWAIAHTLDFTPPAFRLDVRDAAGATIAQQELTIPYGAASGPPAITLFETDIASLTSEQVIQPIGVTWHLINRPPRANVIFEQILDDGSIISIDLPRPDPWTRSNGRGLVQPQPDGSNLTLRARLVNIDTGEVYTQRAAEVQVIGAQPQPPDVTGPNLVTFATSNHHPRRGDTITVTWHAENTDSVRIEVYDISYFPRQWSPGPAISHDNLPAAGSLDLVIPADYTGGGWQIHALANRSRDATPDYRRLDILFSDLDQPVMLNVDSFTVSAETARRGDRLSIAWDTHLTTHTIRNGRIAYDLPLEGYSDLLWVRVLGVVVMGTTDSSPFDQQFLGLSTQGSLEVSIGDYAGEINGIVVQLGINVRGQEIMVDNIFLSLTN